jgi:hypothetical protein
LASGPSVLCERETLNHFLLLASSSFSFKKTKQKLIVRGIRVGTAVVTHFFITRSRVHLFISKNCLELLFFSSFPFRHLRQETLITFYNDLRCGSLFIQRAQEAGSLTQRTTVLAFIIQQSRYYYDYM